MIRKFGVLPLTAPLIAPSLLAADFTQVGAAVECIEGSGADWIHLDVMDGSFVPNISFGSKMLADVGTRTDLLLDLHLMVDNPERHIQDFIAAGAHCITLHLEACVHHHRAVQLIRNAGVGAGIAIVPSTPVSLLEDILPELDLVLLMSVNPGFGGQEFIPSSLEKLARLVDLRACTGSRALISVDGGVNTTNSAALRAAGADVLVCGSAFFRANDPVAEVELLRGSAYKSV